MAKRFTDSRKWDDDWFLELEPKYKLLWLYMLDRCDHAGFFKPNLRLASFCTGSDFNKEKVFTKFEGRIREVSGRWFIIKYINFQYGLLTPKNNMYKAVMKIINDVDKGLVSPFIAPCKGVGRGKGKGKGKDISKDKDNINNNTRLTDKDFIRALKENQAYKHINFDQEFGKMDAWLNTRPGRKKTKRFIVNWLNKVEGIIQTGGPKKRNLPSARDLVEQYKKENEVKK